MEFIINAFAAALSLEGILAMVTGTVVGLVIGALPGLGPSIGVALMLPFTYTMDPLIALLLLTSLFQGAEYGGSVSAVLLNTPGTPGASATVLDGYPMNRQGFPGKALACSLVPSCLGGLAGVISLFALSSVVVKVAVTFGPAEFFSLGLFGLTAVVSLSNGNLVKGCIAAILGLVISCVGLDVISGMPRFTLGVWSLYEGFPLVPVLIGMFAISEAFVLISEELETKYSINKENLRLSLTWREFKAMIPAIGIGTAIGVAMGIFPGVGTTTASWLSYNETKRFSKHPEKFGTGIPEGIAAPEAANNAVVASSLLPMLTLGIPGSPTAAIIMGALIIQGVQPGPDIMAKHPEMLYGLYAVSAVSVVLMLAIGWFATGFLAKVVKVPNQYLAPLIIMLASVGTYVTTGNVFYVGVMFGFGALGYLFKRLKFPIAPFILAFVLSDLLEANLRRALLISGGSPSIFFTRPISCVLLLLCFGSLAFSIGNEIKGSRRRRAAQA